MKFILYCTINEKALNLTLYADQIAKVYDKFRISKLLSFKCISESCSKDLIQLSNGYFVDQTNLLKHFFLYCFIVLVKKNQTSIFHEKIYLNKEKTIEIQ